MKRLGFLVCCVWPLALPAVTLEFPGNATLTTEQVSPVGRYDMPTGPWSETGMPVLSGEGETRQQAWRIDAAGLTTQQILRPLRTQLEEAGFEILFQCRTEGCGGYDFRFATSVLPAPDMYVDLGDFLFLAAERPDPDGAELISLFISRSSQAGFVQVSRVGPATNDLATSGGERVRAVQAGPVRDFASQLETDGHVILSDLTFETGSAQLQAGAFESLQQLADYLLANPERAIALVGHTDAVGSLDGNITLSRRRAGSVLERLATDYGVPRRQMEAQGMGYLSPIASNLTEEGRDANRRVEAIMTSTE